MRGLLVLFLLLNVFFLQAQNLELVWESPADLRDPESIVYDSKRNCFYVSNMDKSTPVSELRTDPVSKIGMNGEILDIEWMPAFSSPTGLLLLNDTLFIVEREGIAIVDVEQKKILQRISVPNNGYLNDITMDEEGSLYISDSEKGIIYRIQNNEVDIWYTSSSGGGINGLFYNQGKILFGDNGDHTFKSICTKNKKVKDIAYLGEGNIDGIQKLSPKQFLVSHFLGNIYIIDTKGKVKEIFNSRDKNLFVADFTYLPQQQWIVIPSLRTHHIFSLSYEP